MDYPTFVRQQQDAFLHEFETRPGDCWIGTSSLEKLAAWRYLGRGAWRQLAGYPVSEVVVYTTPAQDPELWVRPRDKAVATGQSYRTYWDAYLDALGVAEAESTVNGRAVHIDHMLPETFAARQAYAYVRVLAVDARSNVTVGSTVERSMSARTNPGKSYLADWFTAAKASGYLGSFARGSSATASADGLRDHLAARGFQTLAYTELRPEHIAIIVDWSRAP